MEYMSQIRIIKLKPRVHNSLNYSELKILIKGTISVAKTAAVDADENNASI